MATGIPTPNAGLNQWQLADKLRMDEFNADNLKVDGEIGELRREVAGKADLAELAAKADRSELEALSDSNLDAKTVAALLERIEALLAALGDNTLPGGNSTGELLTHERTLLLLTDTMAVDVAFARLDTMEKTGEALADIIPTYSPVLRACKTVVEIAESLDAMNIVFRNVSSTNAIVASSHLTSFINQLLTKPEQFELFVNNRGFMEEIAGRTDIVRAILNSTVAMAALMESSMALNMLRDSQVAMSVITEWYASMSVQEMLTSIFTGNTIALAVRVPYVVKRIYDNVSTNQLSLSKFTKNGAVVVSGNTTITTGSAEGTHNQEHIKQVFNETPVGFVKLKLEQISGTASNTCEPFRIANTISLGNYYNADSADNGFSVNTAQSVRLLPDPMYAESDRRSRSVPFTTLNPRLKAGFNNVHLYINSKDYFAVCDGASYAGTDAIVSGNEMFFGVAAYSKVRITISAAMFNVTGGA